MVHFVHGDAPGTGYTPEYGVWAAMKRRCGNPNSTDYSSYGGRGIKVCKRWVQYENFLKDMGRRPSPLHTLDRKNNNRNYTPSNCRWVTQTEQQRNRRNTKLSLRKAAEIRRAYVYGSRTHGTYALAEKYGVSPRMIVFVIRNKQWRTM